MDSQSTEVVAGVAVSPDGSRIAWDRRGRGPAVVQVDGALYHRAMDAGTGTAGELADEFTAYRFDRRGRGDSTENGPYALEREIEDLAAVVDAAGGSAHVVGVSSGGALALRAAAAGVPMESLVLYELPFNVDGSGRPIPADFADRVLEVLRRGERVTAVEMFMDLVGMPSSVLDEIRGTAKWEQWVQLAGTIPHDVYCVQPFARGDPLPPGVFDTATVPTLVLVGGHCPASMETAARALADVLPQGRHEVLTGEQHTVGPVALAAAFRAFVGR